MLAGAADANKYLDQTKLSFANDDDARDEIKASDAYMRSALFDVYGDDVYLWELSPTPPQVAAPSIVTEYAAMWMAALRYSKVYSEETLTENSWAGKLFSMVEGWVGRLRSGETTITGQTSGIAFNEDDFWPNDETVDPDTGVSTRKFTMDMVL